MRILDWALDLPDVIPQMVLSRPTRRALLVHGHQDKHPARYFLVESAEGVGSRFRVSGLPSGYSLPETNSRPRSLASFLQRHLD
jgi:hypothetical protein